MSRLAELIEYYSWKVNELAEGYEIATRHMETGEIKEYNKGCQRIDDTLEALRELKYYENLEEQGRLIELPCKVGDAVYEILPPCNDTLLCDMFKQFYISRCINKECGHYIQIKQFRIEMLGNLGKTVFLTKEEAEAKLKELKGE